MPRGGSSRGRLNRTSVGLKLEIRYIPAGGSLPPQSNQRGIETGVRESGEYMGQQLPQSNQRGIET